MKTYGFAGYALLLSLFLTGCTLNYLTLPGTLDFGVVHPGAEQILRLEVSARQAVQQLVVRPPQSEVFSLVSSDCPSTLNFGQRCAVTLKYRPLLSRPDKAQIVLQYQAKIGSYQITSSQVVGLQGIGWDPEEAYTSYTFPAPVGGNGYPLVFAESQAEYYCRILAFEGAGRYEPEIVSISRDQFDGNDWSETGPGTAIKNLTCVGGSVTPDVPRGKLRLSAKRLPAGSFELKVEASFTGASSGRLIREDSEGNVLETLAGNQSLVSEGANPGTECFRILFSPEIQTVPLCMADLSPTPGAVAKLEAELEVSTRFYDSLFLAISRRAGSGIEVTSNEEKTYYTATDDNGRWVLFAWLDQSNRWNLYDYRNQTQQCFPKPEARDLDPTLVLSPCN